MVRAAIDPAWPIITRRHTLMAALALPLSACAPLQRRPAAELGHSGRLSLSVRGDPPQSFSAGFELRGHAETGLLVLTSPLGTTLARARWSPGQAQLLSGSQAQQFTSMEELLAQLTGAALPLGALFDWLDGRATPVPGWETDLSQREQGRLFARRLSPLPAVELRLMLNPS